MLKAISSILLAAIGTAGSAQPQSQPQSPPTAGPEQHVVVVGDRDAYRRRLAECLARRCPPNEDIDATTALAEVLFDEGEYREARTVLRASIGRNRDEAARYPEPVSDLYRANARVTRQLGFDQEALRSTWQILSALRAGLPVEDHRHFTARLEIIESLTAFGEYQQAQRELRELRERASAAGRDEIVATAELRSLWISFIQGPTDNSTVRRLIELSASPDPRRSVGAKMLLVRIYNERGDRRRADEMIAQLGTGGAHRTLLFAPSYQVSQQDNPGASRARGSSIDSSLSRPAPPPGGESHSSLVVGNLANRMTEQMEDQWIDVAFRIRADGTVEDVQVAGRRGSAGWERPLLESIASRRYSTTADGSKTQRLERYTYTSRLTHQVTGTHIPDRTPSARVEYTLLSETNLPPSP